jgi:hypothetical protein
MWSWLLRSEVEMPRARVRREKRQRNDRDWRMHAAIGSGRVEGLSRDLGP